MPQSGILTKKLALQELLLQQTANLALLPASINLLLILVQDLLLLWSLSDEDAYVNLQRQLHKIMHLIASRRFRFWCFMWYGLFEQGPSL